MSPVCPSCGKSVEVGDAFCIHCGAAFAGGIQADSGVGSASPPGLSNAAAGSAVGWQTQNAHAEQNRSPATALRLLIEVETNRRHCLNYSCLLRFRVTNMARDPESSCDVTIRTRLHGQGSLVEQATKDIEQSHHLERRGDPSVFAFSFVPLKPGETYVDELRVSAKWCDDSAKPSVLELPDASLLVSVADPNASQESPNVVIHGGIHIDLRELKEVYGSDIKDILTINAQREAAAGEPGIQWEPIRLRELAGPQLPPTLRLSLPGDVTLELVRIRSGQFVMGSPEGAGRDDEQPARRVSITRDFYTAEYPVTQEQYHALIGQNPSKFPISPQHPVENVSWNEAKEFCHRLRCVLKQSAELARIIHMEI